MPTMPITPATFGGAGIGTSSAAKAAPATTPVRSARTTCVFISIICPEVLARLERRRFGLDGRVLDDAPTEDADPFVEVVARDSALTSRVRDVLGRPGNRRLVWENPAVECPTDRPEVVERRDRERAAGDAQQPDGLPLELVEAAVVEGVLQHARVRAVVHRCPEDDGVRGVDGGQQLCAVSLIRRVAVGVER